MVQLSNTEFQHIAGLRDAVRRKFLETFPRLENDSNSEAKKPLMEEFRLTIYLEEFGVKVLNLSETESRKNDWKDKAFGIPAFCQKELFAGGTVLVMILTWLVSVGSLIHTIVNLGPETLSFLLISLAFTACITYFFSLVNKSIPFSWAEPIDVLQFDLPLPAKVITLVSAFQEDFPEAVPQVVPLAIVKPDQVDLDLQSVKLAYIQIKMNDKVFVTDLNWLT